MRTLVDSDNSTLREVLEILLVEDVDISLDEIIARHGGYKNKSAISRNDARSALVNEYKNRQRRSRDALGAPVAEAIRHTSDQLLKAKAKLSATERQNEALRSSLVACIDAVVQHGASESLTVFYSSYSAIAEKVRLARIELPQAEILTMPARSGTRKRT